MSQEPDSGLQQLKAKLERGAAQAARGELLDGDKVVEVLRVLIQERARLKKSE